MITHWLLILHPNLLSKDSENMTSKLLKQARQGGSCLQSQQSSFLQVYASQPGLHTESSQPGLYGQTLTQPLFKC